MGGSYWCECSECIQRHGGRVVGKTTWYSHNPEGTQSRRSPLPQMNPSRDVESRPVDFDTVEPPEDPGPLDNADQMSLYLVGVVHVI